MQKLTRFFGQNYNQRNFGLFLPKFGCHGKSLGSLEFLLPYLNSPTPKTLLVMQKLTRFLDRTIISVIFAYYCPNLVAMANLLAPLKFFGQNYNQRNFGLFLPKFGCHVKSLGSLEIFVTIFEFSDPENLTTHAKIDSIF